MESMLRTRPESFLQILPDTLPGKERSGSRRRGVRNPVAKDAVSGLSVEQF